MEGRIDQKKRIANTSHRWIWSESWNDWIDRGHDVGAKDDPGTWEPKKKVTADPVNEMGTKSTYVEHGFSVCSCPDKSRAVAMPHVVAQLMRV